MNMERRKLLHNEMKIGKGFNENSRIEDLKRIYVEWKFNYTTNLFGQYFSAFFFTFSLHVFFSEFQSESERTRELQNI